MPPVSPPTATSAPPTTTMTRFPAHALHPTTITPSTFRALLATYPHILSRISDRKASSTRAQNTSKPAPKKPSLAELDEYRYVQLPAILAARREGGEGLWLDHGELVRLIDWKLSHGTFRPGLAARIAANKNLEVRRITKEGLSVEGEEVEGKEVDEAEDVRRRVKILSELGGVGPATATLILAVARPDEMPFFGDEVFRWLCLNDEVVEENRAREGAWRKKGKIGYTIKEYEGLWRKVRDLRRRLVKEDGGEGRIAAVDVERVAFVLGNAWEEVVSDEADGKENISEKETAATDAHLGQRDAADEDDAPDHKATAKRKRDARSASSSRKATKTETTPATRSNPSRANRPKR